MIQIKYLPSVKDANAWLAINKANIEVKDVTILESSGGSEEQPDVYVVYELAPGDKVFE